MFSRTKEALFDAKLENATLKLEVKALEREVDRLEAAVSKATSDAHGAQMRAQEFEKNNAVLLERLDLLANHLPEPKAYSWPEEAEDAEHALSKGEIDFDEFSQILDRIGAVNTEVAFDASDYPRLSGKA
jgi:hypothetical protein